MDGLNVYVAGKATLNYAFERYIATKNDLRDTTKANYLYMYNNFVKDTLGKRKLADIKYSDIVFFYQSLITEKELQVNTVDTIHTIIHPVFTMAVRDDIIRKNPASGVMADIKKNWGKNKGIRHALTLNQQRAFINYTVENPTFNHWWTVYTVLLGTGCRVGEFVGLRWEDIDFEKRTININHSIVYVHPSAKVEHGGSYMVSLPKTEAGIRIIPMLDEVYEALKFEYDRQSEEGFSTVELDGMSGFIFTNRFGNIYNQQTLNKGIRRIRETYNQEEEIKAKKEKRDPLIIPKFSCHHLRHTFCTRLCEHETNLKVIQSIMGHKNIETTMDIYAEATESKKEEAMKNLSEKLSLF